jgi:hypothetical protein
MDPDLYWDKICSAIAFGFMLALLLHKPNHTNNRNN